MDKVLITGSAGFIGFHLVQKYLSKGWQVKGIDSFTAYYDVNMKRQRNKILEANKSFSLEEFCMTDKKKIEDVLINFKPRLIIHLAAQAGVRYSLLSPKTYLDFNIVNTFNLLEASKNSSCEHILIASTSSVYGENTNRPYKEIDKTDHQLSFYAATKKSMEVMSHTYSHLFQIPITCFRFFTVFGPWGRPDMAPIIFAKKISINEPINVYNHGLMKRDFTYIDDLVEGIVRLAKQKPDYMSSKQKKIKNDSLSSVAPWRVVNIGSANPVGLMDFIEILEEKLGKKAKKKFIELQKGDVSETYADVSLLKALTGYQPSTSLSAGLDDFIFWFINYSKNHEVLI